MGEIKNFNMYGGNYIAHMDVHDNTITISDDGKITTALKNGGGENIGSMKSNGFRGEMQLAPVTAEMIKTAATTAINLKGADGKDVFTLSNHWQSVYRILKDVDFETSYAHFTKMIQHLFPIDELRKCGKEKIYLKDPTNFSGKDCGNYKKPFSEWKKEDEFTGEEDPRYLIAEKFKETLDGLRHAAALKQRQ